LAGDTSFGASLGVSSDHATLTATLNTANHNLSAGNIIVGLRGILLGQSSNITCFGYWNSTLGTWTMSTSSVNMTGGSKYVDMASGQKFYDLEIAQSASITPKVIVIVNHTFKGYGSWSGIIEIEDYGSPVFVGQYLTDTLQSDGSLTINGTSHQLRANPATGGVSITNLSFNGYQAIKVVGIGDSIMSAEYTQYLSHLLGIPVIYEGIAGQKTADVLARFASDVIAYSPDYVNINVGFNDLNQWGSHITPATMESNLGAMYNQSIAAGIKVIANTVTPTVSWGAQIQANFTAVNSWIRSQASSWIQVVDMASLMADPLNEFALNPIYESYDHVHPSLAGYDYMATCTHAQAFTGSVYQYVDGIFFKASATSAVTFTLSGLESGRMYRLYVDGEPSYLLTATGSGVVSFTYSGPWSEHQFEIVATSITGSISPLVNLIFVVLAVGIVAGGAGEAVRTMKKTRSTKDMIRGLLNMVVYIIIGLASLGIVYSMVA
jgi:lysophospholipase L1-like esterase